MHMHLSAPYCGSSEIDVSYSQDAATPSQAIARLVSTDVPGAIDPGSTWVVEAVSWANPEPGIQAGLRRFSEFSTAAFS